MEKETVNFKSHLFDFRFSPFESWSDCRRQRGDLPSACLEQLEQQMSGCRQLNPVFVLPLFGFFMEYWLISVPVPSCCSAVAV